MRYRACVEDYHSHSAFFVRTRVIAMKYLSKKIHCMHEAVFAFHQLNKK